MTAPRLILGEAVAVMASMPAASIDMVYADPPFGNRQVWTGPAGSFDDRWTASDGLSGWTALREHSQDGYDLMRAVAASQTAQGYLGFMAGLILAARRLLRPTGTLWLHFDDTMGAPLRILCDVIFGPEQAAGCVTWRRTSGGHNSSKSFGRSHDTIACFCRTRVSRWRLWRGDRSLIVGEPISGLMVEALLDESLNARSKERVGYPTQKPIALIQRFISAATLPGDVVLDPTCGSGTTGIAAMRLGRRAICIDRSEDAISAARNRIAAEAPRQADLFGRVAA